jgi:hypothetical protein
VSQSQDEQDAVWDWDAELEAAPKPSGQRAYVRIGIRVATITIPITAFLLLALAGGGSSSKPVYSGQQTEASVTSKLTSYAPLTKGGIIHCTAADQVAGAVSQCTVYPEDTLSTAPVEFDVDYVDAQGDYTFKAPGTSDGTVIAGNVFT